MIEQSWWKTLLSYITEVSIIKKESLLSGTLEIIYKKGRYSLCSERAVYSYEDLYSNFRDSFAQMPLTSWAIKKVLVLGLGLGSIPYMLEKTFKQNYSYTLVELDSQVIELAKSYGCLSGGLASSMQVLCADAAVWASQAVTTQYDLIAIDIFVDDEVPSNVETIDFLQNLKKWLAPQGTLMCNRLTYTEKLKQKTQAFWQNKFQQVFPAATYLPLQGNWMLFNRPLKP